MWPAGDGVRVDTHIVSGASVPPFYDSLLAKIIATGNDHSSSVARMRSVIAETRVEGVATNLSFHAELLADPEFEKGGVDTSYVRRFMERWRLPLEA